MRRIAALFASLALLCGVSSADDVSDSYTAHLYAGTAAQGLEDAQRACDLLKMEGCFGVGLIKLVFAYEGLAQDLYRHGAVAPGETPFSLLLGFGSSGVSRPANPQPEPLTYEKLRNILDRFVVGLDESKAAFQLAVGVDYSVTIDPMLVRIDLNGDGAAGQDETLGALIQTRGQAGMTMPEPEAGKTKDKTGSSAPDTSIGFDQADALWFAGYTQVTAAPFDLLLAHDFSEFFDAYMHRIFPEAGLPMQDHTTGGILFLDPTGDSGIADMIASIHTLNFPVTDRTRLSGVLDRLRLITSLSRQNWEAILRETDDSRELVPSPTQTTSLVQLPVTQEIVDAWLTTLDTVDQVLAGELLVPHWRFKQGFDLKLYFETAERTDLVLLFTGSDALPYLRDGPIADEQSFAHANETLGYNWLNYAFWFN